MGAKLEEKVLKSIAQYRQRTGRFLLSFGQKVAAELIPYLSETGGVEQDHRRPAACAAAGKPSAISICWSPVPAPAAALDRFVQHPKAHEVLGEGENKASVQFGREGLASGSARAPAESFGAAMQYFTGSKDHNVAVRSARSSWASSSTNTGSSASKTKQRVAGETEEEVYEALGLPWIPPELRENCGEIEAAAGRPPAEAGRTPDIRGDLHMHTTETDGRATLEEMAEAAHALGYEYIAITDHSKALAMANGLDEKRVVAFAKQVRELNRSGLPLRIFSGTRMRHSARRRDGSGQKTRSPSSTS